MKFQKKPTKHGPKVKYLIIDFVKEKLGIEEDILIETAHRMGKIQRSERARNKKRSIVVKFLNFKGKSRILHTYRS